MLLLTLATTTPMAILLTVVATDGNILERNVVIDYVVANQSVACLAPQMPLKREPVSTRPFRAEFCVVK